MVCAPRLFRTVLSSAFSFSHSGVVLPGKPKGFPLALRDWMVALLALCLTGCYCCKDGHGRAYIVGFGVVCLTNGSGAVVQDVRGLGLVVDDAVSFGLIQRHRVEIDPQQAPNIVVSVSANPFATSIKSFDFRTNTTPAFTTKTNQLPNP
jgi:hypothetical protein